MLKWTVQCLALSLGLLSISTAPSRAAILTLSFEATLLTPFADADTEADKTNTFGTLGLGPILSSYDATGVIRFDLGSGNLATTPTSQTLSGVLTTNPIIDFSFTLNGITVTRAGNLSGLIHTANFGTVSEFAAAANYRQVTPQLDEYVSLDISLSDSLGGDPFPSLITPFVNVGPYASFPITNDYLMGHDGYVRFSYLSVFNGSTVHDVDILAYEVKGISLTISSSVPEPSTWAMMILGFTGLGVLHAKRRKPIAIKHEPEALRVA